MVLSTERNTLTKENKKMVRKNTINKMAMDLRKKYFAKSDYMIVAHDIMTDIQELKKYENLNSYQMAELFKSAVCMTDGEEIYKTFEETFDGNILKAFIFI
jgi:predicted HNH restriction endonuclease